ncbi:hypothetical protein H3V53_15310 [Paraburkholderia bengalensis]|uniref:Uncharacterized protein n=1 Tax=Paraburkholderia bengalensis TaxID=2747562 RepID=A0ABU8ISX9_9BURK
MFRRRAELCGAFTDDIIVHYAGAELGLIHLLRVVGKGVKRFSRSCRPSLRRSAAIWPYAALRAVPSPARGTTVIPAQPDKQRIGRVEREAAAKDVDVQATPVGLPRQTRPDQYATLYAVIKRFFAVAMRRPCFTTPVTHAPSRRYGTRSSRTRWQTA